jgi:hypothetical protein
VDKAILAGSRVRTSQLALPTDACNAVFATSGYEQSVNNFKMISLGSDNVFSDGSCFRSPAAAPASPRDTPPA